MSEPTSQALSRLKQQLQNLQTREITFGEAAVHSGCSALDQLLPTAGFPRGSLVEWFIGSLGSGAETLALNVALQACSEGGGLVVIDRAGRFYPPAAEAWGISLQQLVVIQPRNGKDELWALDQVLRCPGVSAVWAPIAKLDGRAFRRLQLAVENSGSLGLLLRPERMSKQPSWAHYQLRVHPQKTQPGSQGRRVRVELVRCRGALAGSSVELEIDEITGNIRKADTECHATHSMHLATQLANPTPRHRSTRA